MKSVASYLKPVLDSPNRLFLLFIRFYVYFKPLFKKYPTCRFEPCCSSYCFSCFKSFNFFKAFYYSSIRLLKCHPFGSYGYDPVPKIKNSSLKHQRTQL